MDAMEELWLSFFWGWEQLTKNNVHQGQSDASTDGGQDAGSVGNKVPFRRILEYSLSWQKGKLVKTMVVVGKPSYKPSSR